MDRCLDLHSFFVTDDGLDRRAAGYNGAKRRRAGIHGD